MKICVGFPWRATPERTPVFRFVWDWWANLLPDAELLWADTDHEIFNLNACRNEVVRQAETLGAEVVVICDADVILSDPEAAQLAIDHSWNDGSMTKPHGKQRYLTMEETAQVMRGDDVYFDSKAHGDGCIYIVQPKQWWAMGGADERFIGYGGDDFQIVMCAENFIGLRWFHGVAYSLYHADECRPIGSPAQQRNARLADAYGRLRGYPHEMQKFIDSRKHGFEGTGGYE